MEGAENINSGSKKRKLHMMPEDFLAQFSSKADMVSYLKEQLQYYLPPSTMITSDWVKQVIRGEKDWLKCNVVVHSNPPR